MNLFLRVLNKRNYLVTRTWNRPLSVNPNAVPTGSTGKHVRASDARDAFHRLSFMPWIRQWNRIVTHGRLWLLSALVRSDTSERRCLVGSRWGKRSRSQRWNRAWARWKVKVAPRRLEERIDLDRHALTFTRVYVEHIRTHCEIYRGIFLSFDKSDKSVCFHLLYVSIFLQFLHR